MRQASKRKKREQCIATGHFPEREGRTWSTLAERRRVTFDLGLIDAQYAAIQTSKG